MMPAYNDNLDNQRIKEFKSYFEGYFGAKYQQDQGLNEITDMISKYSTPGTWIDLGGGTSTFIWLPAFNEITMALSVDKYLESSYIQEQVRGSCMSDCYLHILNRYGRNITNLDDIPITYLQMDLFEEFVVDEKYNNVSQFGLLGLCQTKKEYIKRLDRLICFMDNEAVFFGANWLFSTQYAEIMGFANSYLETALIEDYAFSINKTLLYSNRISIANDPNYDAVVIYALKND